MTHRLRRFQSSLLLISAGPLALVGWLAPVQYATFGQATLLVAALAALFGLIRAAGAYVRYVHHRRRFQRVLAAEEAWRSRWRVATLVGVRFRLKFTARSTHARTGSTTTGGPVTTATA